MCDMTLVAATILDLNDYMDMRQDFYNADLNEVIPDEVCWYDLFYGLLSKDKELYNGVNYNTIKSSFLETGFPVQNILFNNE